MTANELIKRLEAIEDKEQEVSVLTGFHISLAHGPVDLTCQTLPVKAFHEARLCEHAEFKVPRINAESIEDVASYFDTKAQEWNVKGKEYASRGTLVMAIECQREEEREKRIASRIRNELYAYVVPRTAL